MVYRTDAEQDDRARCSKSAAQFCNFFRGGFIHIRLSTLEQSIKNVGLAHMSLLTLVQNAADRLGIVRPSTVIGSADQQIRQLLGLAQQEGKELSKRFPWQSLQKEKTITATATETQSGAIPADFDRFIIDTFYNRTKNRRVLGPMNPQEWQNYKASITTVIFDAFRQRGNSLLLAPTPTADESYAYEYMSTYWVATAAADTTPAQATWMDDSDVGILSEELMTDGVVWRFLKSKGLDYAEAFRTYEAQVMLAGSIDGGVRRTVSFAGPTPVKGPMRPNWPDGSWSGLS